LCPDFPLLTASDDAKSKRRSNGLRLNGLLGFALRARFRSASVSASLMARGSLDRHCFCALVAWPMRPPGHRRRAGGRARALQLMLDNISRTRGWLLVGRARRTRRGFSGVCWGRCAPRRWVGLGPQRPYALGQGIAGLLDLAFSDVAIERSHHRGRGEVWPDRP